MILESPVHHLQEGDAVTLHCTYRETSLSNLTAEFYKDNLLIGHNSTGVMTIPKISKSDEGSYKCNVSGTGESPYSWLSVRGEMILGLLSKYFRCALSTKLS